jgi:hypothetical protein
MLLFGVVHWSRTVFWGIRMLSQQKIELGARECARDMMYGAE